MEQSVEAGGCVPPDLSEDTKDEVELDSVTLARLMSEVRNDEPVDLNAYNRQHNRHNR